MRALLSVYNKTGIVDLARELHALGIELVSSGGTAKVIAEAGIPVTDVAELTGYPAMLGHRVVTLHPLVHGGILADRSDESHLADVAQYDIPLFDIVVVNLYPFSSDPSIDLIDIGGPAMVRAAAKNHEHVAVVVNPSDYGELLGELLQELRAEAGTTLAFRKRLARKAFAHTAAYDAAIVNWLDEGTVAAGELPETIHVAAGLNRELKYGENAHQSPAGLYIEWSHDLMGIAEAEVLGGNAGFVNWADTDRMIRTAQSLVAVMQQNHLLESSTEALHAVVAVKHGNPCGAAVSLNWRTAVQNCLLGDLQAVFGGFVVLNFRVDEEVADQLLNYATGDATRRFLNGVVAPVFTDRALRLLRPSEQSRLVVIQHPGLRHLGEYPASPRLLLRQTRRGWLYQPESQFVLDFDHPELESVRPLTEEDKRALGLAWAVGSTSNSNTSTLTDSVRLLGNGVGQQDRVGSVLLAGERYEGAARQIADLGMTPALLEGKWGYTDSFFPFPDGLEAMAELGIGTVFASRGSVRDDEVRERAIELGVNLVTLPDSLCRGFYGH